MIAALIAMQVMQPQPMVQARPAPVKPNTALIARHPDQKHPEPKSPESKRMIAQAHELLARAEAVRADYAPAAGQPSRAQLDTSIDQMKGDLDSMSEMGEMQSLRLQMTMDRMSKMMSTLSNLLKKISDTQSSIVQNMK